MLVTLCCAFPSFGEVLHVEYSRFYSHTKKLDNEDTQALQFAFGFLRVGENRLCEINHAQIVTDKQTLPLEVSEEGRFTVPTDKVLKMAQAMVEVDLVEAANLCDMSVQLETKPEYLKLAYSQQDLNFLLEQYRAFFNAMGSFLSFMMPSVEGLSFQFEDKHLTTAPTEQQPSITMGTLTLSEAWISDHDELTLPLTPIRVTAKASK
ncbi:DUF2987 domain-containing protein [Alteromonas sp. C1M14]|uniref:DUF2987 domain-containing protein n=1 Tax=Alteromonas sp. C1M14 TaxID=2841567 RepID=UPI00339D5497